MRRRRGDYVKGRLRDSVKLPGKKERKNRELSLKDTELQRTTEKIVREIAPLGRLGVKDG